MSSIVRCERAHIYSQSRRWKHENPLNKSDCDNNSNKIAKPIQLGMTYADTRQYGK